jgi:hypothetical protein
VKWYRNIDGQNVDVPVVNGLVDIDAFHTFQIGDGPDGGLPIYDLEGCRNNKKINPGQNTLLADCQSILALALTLQFPRQYSDFTWVTGGVNLNHQDNWPIYSPSHPDQPPWI